jgi:ABC-type Fe3+/spermidine/putrescine transport system ATPase subunit
MSTERSAPVLCIKNVRKLYSELEAIRNVSLDVAANQFVSILGPSGCWKSTLLLMIAGVIDKTAGQISRVFVQGPVRSGRIIVGGVRPGSRSNFP